MFAVFHVENNLICLGGDFFLKLLLVEICFGWTFWVEVPPQILFGTFFPNWLVKISFQIFG